MENTLEKILSQIEKQAAGLSPKNGAMNLEVRAGKIMDWLTLLKQDKKYYKVAQGVFVKLSETINEEVYQAAQAEMASLTPKADTRKKALYQDKVQKAIKQIQEDVKPIINF